MSRRLLLLATAVAGSVEVMMMDDDDYTRRHDTVVGVLPAEPGWRVVFGYRHEGNHTVEFAPVMGWACKSVVWRNEAGESRPQDNEFSAEPLVMSFEDVGLVTAESLCSSHGIGLRIISVLAPGKEWRGKWTDGDDGWKTMGASPAAKVRSNDRTIGQELIAELSGGDDAPTQSAEHLRRVLMGRDDA